MSIGAPRSDRGNKTHLGAILADPLNVVLVALALLLLLDAGHDPPGRAASADHVLVGHREQVALLDGELAVHVILRDLLHLLDHLVIPLRLLGLKRAKDQGRMTSTSRPRSLHRACAPPSRLG